MRQPLINLKLKKWTGTHAHPITHMSPLQGSQIGRNLYPGLTAWETRPQIASPERATQSYG
jgi:hypothetical protein